MIGVRENIYKLDLERTETGLCVVLAVLEQPLFD